MYLYRSIGRRSQVQHTGVPRVLIMNIFSVRCSDLMKEQLRQDSNSLGFVFLSFHSPLDWIPNDVDSTGGIHGPHFCNGQPHCHFVASTAHAIETEHKFGRRTMAINPWGDILTDTGGTQFVESTMTLVFIVLWVQTMQHGFDSLVWHLIGHRWSWRKTCFSSASSNPFMTQEVSASKQMSVMCVLVSKRSCLISSLGGPQSVRHVTVIKKIMTRGSCVGPSTSSNTQPQGCPVRSHQGYADNPTVPVIEWYKKWAQEEIRVMNRHTFTAPSADLDHQAPLNHQFDRAKEKQQITKCQRQREGKSNVERMGIQHLLTGLSAEIDHQHSLNSHVSFLLAFSIDRRCLDAGIMWVWTATETLAMNQRVETTTVDPSTVYLLRPKTYHYTITLATMMLLVCHRGENSPTHHHGTNFTSVNS